MRSRLALLLLTLCLVCSVNAATHVNISIGHQATTNPADVTFVDGQAPAELRAGPASDKHQSDFGYHDNSKQYEEHFGRFRSSDAGSSSNFQYSQGSSARLTASNDGAYVENGGVKRLRQHHQQHQHQRSNPSSQEKQNQEFERYIQSYHGGPTVETVFESATPSSSQRQVSSSSSSSSKQSSSPLSTNGGSSKSERIVAIGSRPTQVHTFERQVALPNAAPTNAYLPPSDDRQTHTIVNHQPKPLNTGSVDAQSVSSSSSSGFDQSNFDQSGNGYNNKPSFGSYDDNDVQNQYPPVIDESSQGDFNSLSGHEQQSHNFYGGSTPAPEYLPSYPRPVVTKTIQIAQPALKAKKYEIRHPAIQKEFYDIEERVVIKPAGTIVVELERPVAKIPKGETILPLGHPHPAVASAYNNNGAAVVQQMGSDVVNSNNNYHSNNQYSPSPVYNPKTSNVNEQQYPQTPVIGSTTIASTLTTTPSYDDDDAKDEFVESNLNKQFNDDAQFVTTTERSYNDDNKQSNNDGGFYVTTTESNRNYNSQFYGRDEPDRRYSGSVGHIEVKNNGAPGVSTAFVSHNRPQDSFAVSGQASYGSGRAQYQPTNNYNENNQYQGKFLNNEFYNQPQPAKPARLQEQPRSFSSAADVSTPTRHIIKHEHNIHLPASQHNIYLGRLEAEPAQQTARLTNGARYNEEAAQVLELKPYLKHHPGAVVVYASSSKRPAAAVVGSNGHYNQQRNYQSMRYGQSPSRTYHNVQYSAPYSQMRHHPDQTARYTHGNEFSYGRHGNLVAGSSNNDHQSVTSTNAQSASHPQAHIQIQIPHHPQEADKPIVVSSTISPSVHNVKEERTARYRQPTGSSSVYYDDSTSSSYQHPTQSAYNSERSANLESLKPDCDQTNDADQARHANYKQQKSLRIVESPNGSNELSDSASGSGAVSSLPSGSVDVDLKSASGHIPAQAGSRVIAATPAPTDAAASSESFHKRRIVVNHPFQTVREVVEHEPITNYHHVQVNEPASPEFYHHTAPYYQQQTHGAIRQVETLPVLYHHHSATTHGNLHYAPSLPFVNGLAFGYHHHHG